MQWHNRLYVPKETKATYSSFKLIIGVTLNIRHIRSHWDEILQLAISIKKGTVTATVTLREVGRIEQTLFILS